jgi:protein-L-isoaspartate(D-aspartate) O-methyltransferase
MIQIREPAIAAILVMVLSVFLLLPQGFAKEAEYAAARAALLEEIRSYAVRDSIMESESFEDTILQSLESVPRHEFVPDKLKSDAYGNFPLPIGYGQTISQPYIVALMTDLVQPGPDDVVLEVGTGSGYQAAVLAKLVKRVYSMEIIEPLADQAGKRLHRLGFGNVETKLGDGYFGWEEHAPYDAIVVTAAASHVPPPLIQQLKPGGRLVIPVGGRFAIQYLLLIEKSEDGEILTRQISAVRFVPLTGDH